MRWQFVQLITLGVLLAALPATVSAESAVAFDWIRQLAGDWEGTYEWTGERAGEGPIRVTYRLTGNGSAVVEDHYYTGPDPLMSSVYHLDGADLRMTHYCGAANQPRFRATRVDPEGRSVTLSFVDVTNLATPTAGHVHSVELEMPDANRLVVKFGYLQDGKTSLETIRLRRAGGAG